MLDDYELLYLASENNEDAINILLNKYFGLIHYKAIKYTTSNLYIDDFVNEGILSFYEAINNYSDKENIKFITYLSICLDCKMINYRKLITRKKHSILNNSTSLEELSILINNSIEDNTLNPESILADKEEYEMLRKRILKKLNYNEELVLILKEQNFSVKEISQIIDVSLLEIYNIIKSIITKTI